MVRRRGRRRSAEAVGWRLAGAGRWLTLWSIFDGF